MPDEDKKTVTCRLMWTLLEVEWRKQGDRRESEVSLVICNKGDDNTTLTSNNINNSQ